MPTIIQNEDQIRALAEIEEKLQLLETLDKAEQGSAETVTVTIGAPTRGRATPCKITLTNEDKEFDRALALVSEYKKRLVKDIKDKAKKFKIQFSDAERKLLDFEKKQQTETAGIDEDARALAEQVYGGN